MHFEVLRELDPVEPTPSPTVVEQPRPRAINRAKTSDRALPAPHATPSEAPAPVETVAQPPSNRPAPTPEGTGIARSLDLSPRAAAYTLRGEAGTGWKLAVPANADHDVDRASEDRLAREISALSRSDGTDREPGKHLAQDINSVIAKPWDLITQPLRKARYQYRGVGFDAVIRADGSVAYRSKSGVQAMAGTAKNIDGEPVPSYGIGFRDSPVDKLFGQDLHASERRRFLEQTRALRELLHERSLRVALARADAHLTRRLDVIANRLRVGDDRRARRELFALWDECAEDEVGASARRRIATFAREHCAEGSESAFTPAELAALNQERSSRVRFQPYQADLGDHEADHHAHALDGGSL